MFICAFFYNSNEVSIRKYSILHEKSRVKVLIDIPIYLLSMAKPNLIFEKKCKFENFRNLRITSVQYVYLQNGEEKLYYDIIK